MSTFTLFARARTSRTGFRIAGNHTAAGVSEHEKDLGATEAPELRSLISNRKVVATGHQRLESWQPGE